MFPSFAPTILIACATTRFASVPVSTGPRNRGEKRPAPCAEIFGAEFLAHEAADVVVQVTGRRVRQLAAELVAEELPAARKRLELARGPRDLCVHERCAHPGTAFPG